MRKLTGAESARFGEAGERLKERQLGTGAQHVVLRARYLDAGRLAAVRGAGARIENARVACKHERRLSVAWAPPPLTVRAAANLRIASDWSAELRERHTAAADVV